MGKTFDSVAAFRAPARRVPPFRGGVDSLCKPIYSPERATSAPAKAGNLKRTTNRQSAEVLETRVGWSRGLGMQRLRIVLLVLVALLAPAPGMAANAAAGELGYDLAISNKFLELHFQRKGGQIAATALVNRIVRRTIRLSADDFALNFDGHPTLHAADFFLREVSKETSPSGQRLSLRLVQRGGTSELAVVYELLDQDFFLRRHLEFSPASPLPLRQVDVWSVGLEGRCCSQEVGPPEYMRHNVWGVEKNARPLPQPEEAK